MESKGETKRKQENESRKIKEKKKNKKKRDSRGRDWRELPHWKKKPEREENDQ